MKHIALPDLPDNAEVHETPDEVLRTKRAAIATGIAQRELGRFYTAPEVVTFRDRSPSEVEVARLAAGLRRRP